MSAEVPSMAHRFKGGRLGRAITAALLALLLFPPSPRLFPPDGIFGAVDARAAEPDELAVWPIPDWPLATPAEVGMDAAKLAQARKYALKGGGSGFITRGGKLVFSWGSPAKIYDLKSTTKSIGVTGVGLALQDGMLGLDDTAQQYHPTLGTIPKANERTGWLDDITIRDLATHTAGFEKDKSYPDILFAPGTAWEYSDGGANWLAEVLTLTYRQDLNELFFSRIFTPLGIARAELSWRNNSARPTLEGIKNREFGSGISASVNALARIGYLYLRNGQWRGQQLIPESFVTEARSAQPSVVGLPELRPDDYGNASDHYGLLWWNNADGTLANVPRDAYWSWGLKDSFIIVIPSLDIVATRAGSGWRGSWSPDYEILRPFIQPIVDSVR
jgi:CubicO group peptidase (beta-lactamase class C family)